MKKNVKKLAAWLTALAAAVTSLTSIPAGAQEITPAAEIAPAAVLESGTDNAALTAAPAFAEADSADAGTETGVQTYDGGEYTYMFSLPHNMKASVITPGADFAADGQADEGELDGIFSGFASIGLNTVIINTMNGGTAHYSPDGGSDAVTAAISAAYSAGISPYVVLDLSHIIADCRSGADVIDTLISRVHRFALKYRCDGIILDDYYARRSAAAFGEYMENGSGVGYTNWLYDTAEQYFRAAAEVIRRTDNTIAAGFIINDMWANSSVNPDGSATEDSFQAYYDGYSDTKSFIEKGYADFALVRAYGSVTSQRLPFEEVTGWWGSLTDKYDIPLYIVHHNEYIGTDTAGWGGEDQLLKQLTIAKKIDSYSGSVFNSFETLKKDPLGSTKTLTSYFNEQINESSLFEDLKMTSPASLTFTTTEATVSFMGSFDSNFPVYFNGEQITLNDAGNFYFEKKLADGLNTFTIKHKSKTYTYSITRKITVLKGIGDAIAEGKTLTVDGGTKITLTANAYKGAKVYGTINGATVAMTETSGINEDDENSSYARYTGTYTVPAGKIGQTQALGKIHIYASYGSYSMEAVGASVTVNAEPEPVKPAAPVIIDTTPAEGSGETVARLEPAPAPAASTTPAGTVKYVKTLSDYTMVYDGKTADDIPTPLFSQLPANTLEVYRSTSGSYYVTASGKRIAASASTLVDEPAITKNELYVKSIGTSNGNSYIKLRLDHRTGFNMRLVGNNYYTAWNGDYNVKSFTATHLYITFENITSVTALPSFENNLVFRSGKWDTVTEDNGTKFRLILELRQPGVYFGHGSRYDENGDLILFFPVPVNSLSGLTVVIDPGHGYGKSATVFDPGAIGEVVEQEVVLAIAKELESQLKDAGAKVIRLKTESEYLLTKQRPIYARGLGCDMFISIHANKALGDARGVEVYYFTSWSQPLAASISSSVAKYYQNSVYSDGANKDRGARYDYFQVTLQQDFPSVLVETGFVDNIQDAMALASPTHRKGIAAGIVSGIKNYIARSSISYATEGYSVNSSPSSEQLPAAAVTTAANTAATTAMTTAATTTVPETTTAADTTAPPEITTADTTEETEPAASETTDNSGGLWSSGVSGTTEEEENEPPAFTLDITDMEDEPDI